jgi:hypothetical protein
MRQLTFVEAGSVPWDEAGQCWLAPATKLLVSRSR